MIEDSLRTLAPAEIITDKMGEIIEAFVAFYGEERRNEIEERLNNVLILKVSSVQSLERNIEYVKENIVREVFGLANEEFYNVDGLVDFLTGKINILYGFDAVRKNLFGSKDITDVEIIQKYKNGEYPKLNEFVKKYEEVLKRMEPYINEMNAGKELESTLKTTLEESGLIIPKNSTAGWSFSISTLAGHLWGHIGLGEYLQI